MLLFAWKATKGGLDNNFTDPCLCSRAACARAVRPVAPAFHDAVLRASKLVARHCLCACRACPNRARSCFNQLIAAAAAIFSLTEDFSGASRGPLPTGLSAGSPGSPVSQHTVFRTLLHIAGDLLHKVSTSCNCRIWIIWVLAGPCGPACSTCL
jgi:hypothetical protein